MGMTYDELSLYGKLRKCDGYGPVSMFNKLKGIWSDLPSKEVAKKVKHFFKTYVNISNNN
jgi:NAD+ synthase (glutamine-hydrolysing)